MLLSSKKNKSLQNSAPAKEKESPPLLEKQFFSAGGEPSDFTKNVVNKIHSIKGFFNISDAHAFNLILEIQSLMGMTGHILEIGSYFGKSTAVLAHSLKEKENLFVCDAFTSTIPDHYNDTPTIEALNKNIQYINPDFDLNNRLKIYACLSSELNIPGDVTFRFIHIDGGHDAETTYSDCVLSFSKLMHKGIIAIDDYAHPDWSGVKAGVDRFLSEYESEITILADFNRYGAKGRKLYLTRVVK